MTRSQKTRLSQSEWEVAHGFSSRINNSKRKQCYENYERYCQSIGLVPTSEMLYEFHVSRISR